MVNTKMLWRQTIIVNDNELPTPPTLFSICLSEISLPLSGPYTTLSLDDQCIITSHNEFMVLEKTETVSSAESVVSAMIPHRDRFEKSSHMREYVWLFFPHP